MVVFELGALMNYEAKCDCGWSDLVGVTDPIGAGVVSIECSNCKKLVEYKETKRIWP